MILPILLPPQEQISFVQDAAEIFGFAGAVAGVLLLPALMAHALWLRKYYPDRTEIVLKKEFDDWKEANRKDMAEVLEKLARSIREDMQAAVNRIGGQEMANQVSTTALLTEIRTDVRQALELAREAREQGTRNGDAIGHLKEVTDLRLGRCEDELSIREKRRQQT